MKKTSLMRALCVAGVMAAAAGMAQADAIFYPDGTHVELGVNAVENGLADSVLARSSTTAPDSTTLASLGVTSDQSTVLASSDDMSIDTTTLGAGPMMSSSPTRMSTTTVTTTTPVYVFPNINFDRHTVLTQPHPMMSGMRHFDSDRTALLSTPMENTAAATFDSPTRAGEASTMTGGAPNMVTDNERVGVVEMNTVPPSIIAPSTTVLGAGPAVIIEPNTTTLGAGPSNLIDPNTGSQMPNWNSSSQCDSSNLHCQYLPN
jgi:hypothetical protein